jgi:hypothetical protein
MRINHEIVDRIIIAAENEIKGKDLVKVQLVETLIRTLRDLNTQYVTEMYCCDKATS